MTLAFQLNDIREAVYRWLSEEIHWKPGDTRLGNVLYEKFWLRVQSLRVSLSEKGFGEQAGDVREHWGAVVAELNENSLFDLLNSTYKRTRTFRRGHDRTVSSVQNCGEGSKESKVTVFADDSRLR